MAPSRHRMRGRRAQLIIGAMTAAVGVAATVVVMETTNAGAATGTVPLAPLAAGVTRPDATALSPSLEAVRATGAGALYGTATAPPLANRKTSVVSIGDSEISGEGLGNYVQGTNGPANYCHRSHDSAILKTGLIVDVPTNLACSGAQTQHLIPTAQGGGAHQYDETNQGDSLSVTARNTRVSMILLVNGANDDNGIQFGPVISDCVQRRILFQGNCWPDYSNGWRERVTNTQANVTTSITSVRRTMREAGYLDTDYQLVVMSYPSPVSPDVEDNPKFPGWYDGGCLLYLKDAAFGRNKAVPMFEGAERAAALAAPGVRYLDNSRLFAGHEACTPTPWANGMVFQDGNITNLNGHNTQQSFHPNKLGAAAFASCLTQMYAASGPSATCVDVDHTGKPSLRTGLLSFQRLRNLGSGLCVDAAGYNSRNGTKLLSYPCTGGSNQGFWYDPTDSTIHSELNQDRCVDVPGAKFTAGAVLQLHECNGHEAQKFAVGDNLVKASGNTGLCVTFADNGPHMEQALTLQPCNISSAAGRFAWQPQVTAWTELKHKGSGLCVDLPGSTTKVSNNMKTGAFTCEGGTDQKWWYNDISGRFHNYRDAQYCLDSGGATSAGGQLVTYKCDSAKAPTQQWVWSDGAIRLKSDQNLAAAPIGASNEYRIGLAAFAPTDAQRWSTGANLPERSGFNYSDAYGTAAY